MSSQFYDENFDKSKDLKESFKIILGYSSGELLKSMGSPFLIKLPDNCTDNEKYDFKWNVLEQDIEPFHCFNY